MASPGPGERIGPYELREELGRGGMGAVHRAVDARTGQEVALKLLLAVADERARRRQLLEARALMGLRHRSVVSLLDAGEDRGRPWLALELVRGRSLQERLDREGPLAPSDAAQLVQALSSGLAHAHREGVLHRDLKPDNVLLPDDGGPPKLTDFGLAGFTFDLSQSRLTRSGTLQGSPGYWSPEQVSGQPDAIGPATDVYGLGAVLYAALTRRPPIEGASLPEVLSATASLRPEPPGADPALDAIALRCLEKDPGDRYPSVAALERELLRYLAGHGPRRPRGRRLVVAGLVTAAALAGTALAPWRPLLTRPPGGASVPAVPAPTTTPDGALALAGRGLARATTGDPQGGLQDLDRALELDPRDASAYVNRGAVRLNLGDLQGALQDLNRALELDPRDASVYVNRGLVKAPLGDLQGALQDFDRAIELDPRLASAYMNRGVARARLGDFQGALPDYDRAIELDPRDGRAYLNRGAARSRLGDDRGALPDYDQAIELAPRDAPAYESRGLARSRLGDDRGALQDHDRAIELGASDARAFSSRGGLRLRLGDDRGALQDYDRAIELGASDARTFLSRGVVRSKLGDGQGALPDYDRAIELDPRYPRAYLNRGLTRSSLGDDRGALQDCDRALELNPRYARAYLTRGGLKARLGDDAGACADWEAALRLEPSAGWAAETTRSLAGARARLERR